MAALGVGSADYSATKRKALEDAKSMQASIVKECSEIGRALPPYAFLELIGKGSFGRVYRAITSTGHQTRQLVAIKVINIEAGDTLDPGAADTFGDVMKEINTLKLLSTTGAKNINVIIDALLVGQSLWVVTEYCAGGSVSSLMRPTGCLPEKWIIPILREVAEAIYWVHKQGIIHRDIKCANVLITDTGDVQLCDFGVAAVVQTRSDKRTTVTGTLQWMAPELFDSTVAYGAEVDIWAFGSMAYEVASGLPPNAIAAPNIPDLNAYLKQHCPRLEGDRYSPLLKDFVSHCLVIDPEQRPIIDVVQKHPYILNTSNDYPTSSLSDLVGAYRIWEMQGGNRRSLFSEGGAQFSATDNYSAPEEDWRFSTINAWDEIPPDKADAKAIHDDSSQPSSHSPTSRSRWQRRRPTNIKVPISPLQKIFDPNTLSNYQDNVHAFYNRRPSHPTADLPLRDNSTNITLRESLIDLDSSLNGGELSQFTDADTIKPRPHVPLINTTNLDQRMTMDWTFPATEPSTPGLRTPLFPFDDEGAFRGTAVHATQLYPSGNVSGYPTGQITPNTSLGRGSMVSLIDLDNSLQNVMVDLTPPSSDTEDEPLTLKIPSSNREPSLYVPSENYSYNTFKSLGDSPDTASAGHHSDSSTPRPVSEPNTKPREALALPPPNPPSLAIMQGTSSRDEVKDEMRRIISNLNEHLQLTANIFKTLPSRHTDPSSEEE
ncbi:kinase-like protein [Nemania sp. FL0031]|nr:kinase-like protein [Nemania sp. FL0031]